jgi:uncharacterized protein YaaQ
MNNDEQNLLLIAVVQAQDADCAHSALSDAGVSIARLPSTGGFLGRRNVTLFLGLKNTLYEKAIEELQKNCRQRIEYIAVPLESAPLPLPTPTPITIGGATVFSIEVDHYEVI